MCRLIDKLQALPIEYRESLEKLCNHDGEQRSSVEESVAKLQNSLDYLRLSVKYMVFDLEATRRENVYLRNWLNRSVVTVPEGTIKRVRTTTVVVAGLIRGCVVCLKEPYLRLQRDATRKAASGASCISRFAVTGSSRISANNEDRCVSLSLAHRLKYSSNSPRLKRVSGSSMPV